MRKIIRTYNRNIEVFVTDNRALYRRLAYWKMCMGMLRVAKKYDMRCQVSLN